MDKRSFNFLFAIVAVSMIAAGAYKINKKKNRVLAIRTPTVSKSIK
jgi:hypothetical protein